MKLSCTGLKGGIIKAAILACLFGASVERGAAGRGSAIPYVASRNDAVKDMLYLAVVGNGDVVYDLGSGDGRIVISAVRDFGARGAVGIEKDAARVGESRENAQKAGVAERVEFIEGDLFAADLREASIVTMFLGHQPNITLRPKLLRSMAPGARIVSHQFGMGEWEPDKTLTARTVYFGMWGERHNPFMDNPRVPDYSGNESHFGTTDKMMMWIVPAPVAGVWPAKIDTGDGPKDCRLILHQRLSAVSGMLEIEGQAAFSVSADLCGRHLRLGDGWSAPISIRFDGQVEGDVMEGMIEIRRGERAKESTWRAVREKVDLCGTWEWPCASGPRSVRLRIERRDGNLCATYVDRDKETPVADSYDCGGGFYFTHMIGRDGDSTVITEDTGWLIGEATLDNDALKGAIEFHPYRPARSDNGQPRPVTIHTWTPTIIKP